MAKRKSKSDNPIMQEIEHVYQIVREIEKSFRRAEVTISEGLMVAMVLLHHGVEQSHQDDNQARGQALREQALYSLKVLIQVLEKPEQFAQREVPQHRM